MGRETATLTFQSRQTPQVLKGLTGLKSHSESGQSYWDGDSHELGICKKSPVGLGKALVLSGPSPPMSNPPCLVGM